MQISNLLEEVQQEFNYGEGILTLRLRENVVQMIDDEVEGEEFQRGQNSEARLLEIIPKQDEESIF